MNANVNADAVPLVLGLACRNSHLGSDLQAVCSLLRVSKAVRQAVLDACSGPGSSQLQLTMGAAFRSVAADGAIAPLQYLQRLSHQARWLARHGRLVKQLTINTGIAARDFQGADEAVMCLAVRPPVQLQELKLFSSGLAPASANPAAALQQLDASHLTRLEVGIPRGHGAALLPAALQQLTALHCLRVVAPLRRQGLQQPHVREAYLEALPRLTSLTELAWKGEVPAGMLRQLPASVLKVQLADTSLKLEPQHLADQQQLQQLSLGFSTCDTTALASLSALTNLRKLSARIIAGKDEVLQSVSSLSALPALNQLVLSTDQLAPAAASAIAAGTILTHLQLQRFGTCGGNHTAAYEALPKLQQLSVVHEWPRPDQPDRCLASFGTTLSQGITQLVWCGMKLSPLARTQLITCTQLRTLILYTRSIGDADLEVMGHYMKDLQMLGIAVGGLISVLGVRSALSGGRFPALRKLLAAGEKRGLDASDRAHMNGCVAGVRPLVEVEHLDSFDFNELASKSFLVWP